MILKIELLSFITHTYGSVMLHNQPMRYHYSYRLWQWVGLLFGGWKKDDEL